MKLSSKTFLYSSIISLIAGTTIFLYLFFLMPSMYADFKQKEHLNYATSAVNKLKDEGTLAKVKNSDDYAIGVIIPKEGNYLKLSGGGFDGKVSIENKNVLKLVDFIRSNDGKKIDLKDSETNEEFSKIFDDARDEIFNSINNGLKITFKEDENYLKYKKAYQKYHRVDENTIISEYSIKNANTDYQYTTYVAFKKDVDYIYMVISATTTPNAKEITPVVIRAIPMLILLMILLSFGVSAIFSRKIVNPIEKLAKDAESRASSKMTNYKPIEVRGNDEISNLTRTLNHLYKNQADNFERLEHENKRREVFVKASSHELRTPISAAILLTDGMISKVGKFSDRDKYLPELKDKLRDMMNIVDEMVNINYIEDNNIFNEVDIRTLCEKVIIKHSLKAEAKNIEIICNTISEKVVFNGIDEIYEKIISNLLSNAIEHTEKGGKIGIYIEKDTLRVINSPAKIDEKIKEDIFEPFVSTVDDGESKDKAHGLGLYIAKYFASIMGFDLRAENILDKLDNINKVEMIMERKND